MTRNVLKKVKLLTAITLAICFYSTSGFAQLFTSGGFFLGGGVGAFWPSYESSSSIPNDSGAPAPYDMGLYTISEPGATVAWPVYLGYRFARDNALFPYVDVSFRYEHVDGNTVNGVIDQYSLPNYENYSYSLNTFSDVFTIDGRADIYRWGPISPYVSGGLGGAVNSTSDYNEQAFSGITPRISPAYANNSSGSFSGDVGAGVDYFITTRLWASVGYEYAYLGKVQTGNSVPASNSDESLPLGTITSNSFLFGVFYQLVSF